MDRGQARGQLLQNRKGHEGTVDRGPTLAAGLELAPHHDLVPVNGQAMGLEEGARLGRLEDPFHRGSLLSRADEVGRGSFAPQETHGVYQYGLARSRFARLGGETGPELP